MEVCLLENEAYGFCAADNVPHAIRPDYNEDIIAIDVPNLDLWLTRDTDLVAMKITQRSGHGKSRTLIICPDTIWSLSFFISVYLSSRLNDSLLLNLAVWLVISRQLESAYLRPSLLRVTQLSRGAEHSSRIANVSCVYARLYLKDSDAARPTLPVVLLFIDEILKAILSSSCSDSSS